VPGMVIEIDHKTDALILAAGSLDFYIRLQ
jgi:hypothetical protein